MTSNINESAICSSYVEFAYMSASTSPSPFLRAIAPWGMSPLRRRRPQQRPGPPSAPMATATATRPHREGAVRRPRVEGHVRARGRRRVDGGAASRGAARLWHAAGRCAGLSAHQGGDHLPRGPRRLAESSTPPLSGLTAHVGQVPHRTDVAFCGMRIDRGVCGLLATVLFVGVI